MRWSSPADPKPGRRKNPARMSQVSSWSADVLRWAIQPSSGGQSERTRPAFHSLFAIPRICSSFLRSRVAVIKSRWLAVRANKWRMCDRAASTAVVVTFGLIGTKTLETAAGRSGCPSCSCGRRLNSSGQNCLKRSSALTQETCNKPNSFALAINVTGSMSEVLPGARSTTFMIVSNGGRG